MKLYYSIGEVAKHLDVTTSAIRHWEKEFAHINPRRTSGGERQYTKYDIQALQVIKHLIHEKGMTTEGARALLAQERKDGRPLTEKRVDSLQRLRQIKSQLLELRSALVGGITE